MINDQIAFPPADRAKTSELSVRILPAYRMPDAVLFQRTTDLRSFQRPFPSGLEVGAALGSEYARAALKNKDRERLLNTIDETKRQFDAPTLYCEYLNCLRALVGEPEPDAPAFMSGRAWQAKSCQTALSGWAQLRHAWVLQSKQSVLYMGICIMPSGLVEPVPEFFARMNRLAEKTHAHLRRHGAFETCGMAAAEQLRDLAGILRKLGTNEVNSAEADRMLSRDENPALWSLYDSVSLGEEKDVVFRGYNVEALLKLADRIEGGDAADDPDVRDLNSQEVQIEARWHRLCDLCKRLEILARKQLRGVAFSQQEEEFLKTGYGEELGYLMFYDGTSYESPLDDAPRIADVFSNPTFGESVKYLHVGIGRPRAIYVLYPWQGKEVLCMGAVMPYYEFVHDSRLTDGEWKQMLDSAQKPKSPEWIEPLLGAEQAPGKRTGD